LQRARIGGEINPRGEKVASIVIIPKLGPYGSGPVQAGFEVYFSNLPGDQAEWDEFVGKFNGKRIELTLQDKEDVNLAI